jgi:hypothetical protein
MLLRFSAGLYAIYANGDYNELAGTSRSVGPRAATQMVEWAG